MTADPQHVATDPGLLAAVQARYRGRGDVADQLWWLAHPGSTAPSGRPDPLVALEAARTALYRPGGGAPDPEGLLRELSAADADREAARIALQEADTATPAPVSPAPRRRAGAGIIAGVAAAALVVGLAIGLAAGLLAHARPPAALGVFDVPQQPRDVPPYVAKLPAGVPPSSLRLLGSSSTTGAFAYAARTRDGRVCLVVVVLAASATSTCASEPAFAASGLSLSLFANVDPEDDSGFVQPREIDPTWTPDGRFSF